MNTEADSGTIIILLILVQLCALVFLAIKFPEHRDKTIVWFLENKKRGILAILGLAILVTY